MHDDTFVGYVHLQMYTPGCAQCSCVFLGPSRLLSALLINLGMYCKVSVCKFASFPSLACVKLSFFCVSDFEF